MPPRLLVFQRPEIPSRCIDGEAVLLDPKDSTLHTLNETATFIWEHADGTRTVDDIARALAASFQVTIAQARRDTLAFIEDQVARGLLGTRAA